MFDQDSKPELPAGMIYFPQLLSHQQQRDLIAQIRILVKIAPLYQPFLKSGKIMSVRMTNFGTRGWYSDEKGYRYIPHHPKTGKAWPPIPQMLVQLWQEITKRGDVPDCCLCNFYDPNAKMGLHQDRNEASFDAPVFSLSLGDDAVFCYSPTRLKTQGGTLRLSSGDGLLFGGKSRMIYHGIDHIDARTGASSLLNAPGRVNLTLRKTI
ncbi:MAG: alpha-ketoglutarate-dependent dioxygenase AlkB [Alphaproteobacteria bacterium]